MQHQEPIKFDGLLARPTPKKEKKKKLVGSNERPMRLAKKEKKNQNIKISFLAETDDLTWPKLRAKTRTKGLGLFLFESHCSRNRAHKGKPWPTAIGRF